MPETTDLARLRDSWRDAMLTAGVPKAHLQRSQTSLVAELQVHFRTGFRMVEANGKSQCGEGHTIPQLFYGAQSVCGLLQGE